MTEDFLAKARELRAAGASIEQVKQYLASKGYETGESADEQPGIGTKILGTAASLVRDIPGMEMAQAGARSVLRGQSYDEALSDIRGAEDAAPKAATIPARIAGGVLGAAAVPGGAVRSAAAYGAAGGLADSDMHQSLEDRLTRTAIGAGAGAVAGKVADVGTTFVKAAAAKPIAEALEKRVAGTRAITDPLYTAARAEGAANAGNVPLPLLQALDKPDVKKYADMVMSSRQFANADAATVARETFKLMSKQQTGLMRRLNQLGYDAATALEAENIRLAKQELAQAAGPMMPSWAGANAAYASGKAEQKALTTTAEGVNRVATKAKVAPKNALRNSPQALEDRISAMAPNEAEAGLEGALGMLKQNMKPELDASALTGFGLTKGFGLGPSALKANRVNPFVKQLEEKTGRTMGRRAAVGAGRATPIWLEDLLNDR